METHTQPKVRHVLEEFDGMVAEFMKTHSLDEAEARARATSILHDKYNKL